jgi:hypothetical protein
MSPNPDRQDDARKEMDEDQPNGRRDREGKEGLGRETEMESEGRQPKEDEDEE